MLKLEHVVKKYHNHLALQDLSFTAERGQIIGLLGNNGAGPRPAALPGMASISPAWALPISRKLAICLRRRPCTRS